MLSNLEVLMRRCFKGISRVWIVVVLVLQFVVNLWAGSTSLETLENRRVLCQHETSNNEYKTESLVPESEIRARVYTGLIQELKSTLIQDVVPRNRNLVCHRRVNNFQYFYVRYSR